MTKADFKERLNESINKVKYDTQQLFNSLKRIPYLQVYSPNGNFVMAKILNDMSSEELRNVLLQDKIFIRDCTNKIGLGPNFIRIASRTEQENIDIANHIELVLADFETQS